MERLKVLTVNIWNRQGPWDARRALLCEGIAALAPDVVGLEEVLHLDAPGADPDQAQVLAAALGYDHVTFGPAWSIGFGLELGNAILSRWPLAARAHWALPGREGEEGRGLVYALIDAPCGQVPVFVTHLSWKLHQGDLRIAQVQAIHERIHALAPTSGFPPVLMGDMNAEPDADEMRFLRGLTPLGGRSVYYNDCWIARGDGPGHTFHRDNGYAARAREPSRRIDYVFVRGPDRQLRGEPLACRVVLTGARDDVWPSDHYGVYAEIQAAPVPPAPL